MLHDATVFASRYSKFYADYAVNWWNNISPVEYGGLLIVVSILGWVLMRGGGR